MPGAVPAPPATPPDFAGLSDPDALRFYQQRNWRPAWTQTQAPALTRGLAEARRHGLDRVEFAPKTAPGAPPIQQDVGLTLTALGYARALSSGFVDPKTIEKVFTLKRNEVDLAAGLEQALAGGKLEDWLASLPPVDAEYKALSAAYLDAVGPAGPASAPTPTAPADTTSSKTAPAKTASAKAATAAASATPADRARQLAANLERRRWLARTPPATRIDVNTGGAFLTYVRPDTAPFAAHVVVGRDDHETPSIQASFHKVVANPKWRVPMDIAKKEILPKGAAYMRREHLRVVGGKVEQDPGPHNSLGLVKFDVEDPFEIYLHDTPAKSLFALPERHKSHGCVRVQNAVDFARLLAGEGGKADDFDKALASGQTSEVDIGRSIPVRMLYHTAYADDAGQVTVLPDVYGWNDKLAVALGLGQGPAGGSSLEPDTDVGP
ncbi:MAG: murein L,D-transpeptidase [Caulobacteraceae bacterium]|nr:murein L,D-transpeptidase [Caulobacteraceae bacterium]